MSDKPNILIGTPCYGGQLTVPYFRAVTRLKVELDSQGIGLDHIFRSSESLISRGRNSIVADFLGRPEFTHLLFIDADIGFPSRAVTRLLERNVPLSGTACPMKSIDWNAAKEHAATAKDGDDLKAKSLQYAVNRYFDGDRPENIDIKDGFIEVDYIGTGFMLIARLVFDRMRETYPELQYKNDIVGYDSEYTKDNFWAFFDTRIEPKTRRYLSEDFSFCHRWTQEMGETISVDIATTMEHMGRFHFRGSFLASIMSPSQNTR